VQAILPGLTTEQATLAAQLATVAVEAAIWPNTIPDPLPAPMYEVLLSASVRFGQAILQGSALPVVSESLGSYSYRLAAPATLTGAFGLTSSELVALGPWISRGTCYDVSVSGGAVAWPVDWWQRDYDNIEGAPSAEIPAEYLTQAEGDARYSQVTHEHAHGWSSEWAFSTSTTAADPGGGKVRLNAASTAAATELYLSALDAQDTDWSPEVNALRAGDVLRLQDRDDSTRWVRFAATGPAVDAGVWARVPVAWTAESPTPLAPTNNQALLLYFARAGHNP
jgi:hypothetical protein